MTGRLREIYMLVCVRWGHNLLLFFNPDVSAQRTSSLRTIVKMCTEL
jgi:hypothetical protein